MSRKSREYGTRIALRATLPENLAFYEIAQVLAWVAAQRANVAERLRWRGQIRGLMSHLLE